MKIMPVMFLLCGLFSVPARAVPGETGYNFLKIDPGNRAVGMGGAYAGVAGDGICLFYNPANLSGLENGEFYALYRKWLLSTSFAAFSYAHPFKGFLTAGAGFIFYELPSVDEVDTYGFATGRLLSGHSYAVILSAGRETVYGISFGMNFKILKEALVDSENNSMALDLGLSRRVYATPSDSVRAGIVLQNWDLGTGLDPDNPVPLNLRLGIEYTAYRDFRLNLDVNKQADRDFRYNIGAEYVFYGLLALRAGYKIGYDVENFSLGCGLDAGRFTRGVMFVIDYSFTSLGFLEQSQNISLRIKF